MTSAQIWLTTDQAKSFVSFGADGKTFAGAEVEAGKIYSKEINGKTATRQITMAKEIHPAPQKGGNALVATTSFFGRTLMNKEIQSTNTYLGYNIFSLLALFMSLATAVAAIVAILEIPAFNSLKAERGKKLAEAPTGNEKKWFWILTIVNMIFALLSISFIFKAGFGYAVLPPLPQQTTNIYALWALFNGIFSLIMSRNAYKSEKKNAINRGKEIPKWGINIGFKNFLLSIIVSVIGVAVVMLIAYVAQSVFNMDMRYYLWGIRSLPMDKMYLFFTYLPFYLIFGIAISVSINSACYQKIGNEPDWLNDVFFAVMNMLPPLIIAIIGYGLFMKTGLQPKIFGAPYAFSYMINAIPVFPVATIVIRKIYRYSNNPYIAGITVGALLCFMQVASVFTLHTFMYFGPSL